MDRFICAQSRCAEDKHKCTLDEDTCPLYVRSIESDTEPKKKNKIKSNYFYIYQKLPNLNEFRSEIARSPYKGGQMKAEVEDAIITSIMYAKRQGTLKEIQNYPIQINCVWQMKNRKQDLDNLRSSVKFILDAMQKAQIIPNDSQKYICGLYDEFVIDKEKGDCVKVEIIEPPLKIKLILEGN